MSICRMNESVVPISEGPLGGPKGKVTGTSTLSVQSASLPLEGPAPEGGGRDGTTEDEEAGSRSQATEAGVMWSGIAQSKAGSSQSFHLYRKRKRELMKYSKLGGRLEGPKIGPDLPQGMGTLSADRGAPEWARRPAGRPLQSAGREAAWSAVVVVGRSQGEPHIPGTSNP